MHVFYPFSFKIEERVFYSFSFKKRGAPGLPVLLLNRGEIEENLDFPFSFKIEEHLYFLFSFKIEEHLDFPFSFKIEEHLDFPFSFKIDLAPGLPVLL